MTGHWPQPGQYRTVLAEWVDVLERPTFWGQLARTFCAWTRADSRLPRRLPGTDTPGVKLRLAALLRLAAVDGPAPWVVARARDLHDEIRSCGAPILTADTWERALATLDAALRDHGVPRDIVAPYRAVLAEIGPSVVGDWRAGLHPYLRPSLGTRQLADSAALADYARTLEAV